MAGKKVTLEDIGNRFGVSAVTVSKALKNQKGVGETLRQQIQQTAREMGYAKSSRAHNSKISRTIGVIISERFLENHDAFYWALYQKLAERVLERDSVSILEVLSLEAETNGTLPRIVREQRADGVIIIGTLRHSYMEMLYRETEKRMPLICLDSELGTVRNDIVIGDNIGGGYIMTNYLLSLGHKRIGYVGTFLTTSSIDDRYLGYMKALLEHGVEANRSWMVEDRDRTSGRMLTGKEIKLPELSAGNANELPTAYFCNCDLTATYFIEALARQGIRVPEDVSVVGFDNYLPNGIANAGITTYEIDAKMLAVKAVSRIFQKIDNRSFADGIIVIGGKLIERSSAIRIGEPVPFAVDVL